MHSCMNCQKKKLSLLDGLAYGELEKIERNRTVVNYKKGETIYKEGTKSLGLLCLNAGKAKIVRKGKHGSEQIVGLKKPVDFIGMHALMSGSSYHNSAVAMEDASVCVIDKDDFLGVVNNNNKLSMKLIKMLSKELDDAESRFINMSQKLLRARLADTILYLMDMYGTCPDGQTINCTLKRNELAALSNMTTANVIRAISSFSKEGLISTEKKRLKVKNPELLRTISVADRVVQTGLP